MFHLLGLSLPPKILTKFCQLLPFLLFNEIYLENSKIHSKIIEFIHVIFGWKDVQVKKLPSASVALRIFEAVEWFIHRIFDSYERFRIFSKLKIF